MLCVYDQLEKLEPIIDPTILFALLSDAEATNIYDCAQKGDYLNPSDLDTYSIGEIVPYLRDKNIDFTDPDLDW